MTCMVPFKDDSPFVVVVVQLCFQLYNQQCETSELHSTIQYKYNTIQCKYNTVANI